MEKRIINGRSKILVLEMCDMIATRYENATHLLKIFVASVFCNPSYEFVKVQHSSAQRNCSYASIAVHFQSRVMFFCITEPSLALLVAR